MQLCQNLTHTMAMNTFHCQWIAPSINDVTNYQYTMHCQMVMGLLLLRLISQACQMSMSAQVSIECHCSACTGSHLGLLVSYFTSQIAEAAY